LIDTQINNFLSVNGYTLKGIEATLHYFFELEEREVGEDVKGIGIVPYIYDEAKEYFLVKEKAEKENKGFKDGSKKVEVKLPQKRYGAPMIDITKIE